MSKSKLAVLQHKPLFRRQVPSVSTAPSGQVNLEAIRKSALRDLNELVRQMNELPEELAAFADVYTPYGDTKRRRRLALLLPGHNEELIIATTIRSAIAAGQPREDIFVVDDNSNDNTVNEALKEIPTSNVLSVERSGKGLAVHKAIKNFNLENRYVWIHVADADSVFCPNYFRIYKRHLNAKKYAVAVGFVQSLRGNWISRYRAFTYTYGQHVFRRIQSYMGMISVFPGPITCFKSDIIKHLDLTSQGLTEDFDITLQVHRKKLGKIKFIPQAINYTQDPQTIRDFVKQNLRWQRGFFQGVTKYKIGRRLQPIDISIGYQLLEALFYLVQMLVFVPYVIILTGKWVILPAILLADLLVLGVLAVFSATAIRRPAIITSLPYFYFLRWIELGVFVIAYVEVVLLHRYRKDVVGWSVKGRRYQLDPRALRDTAQ